MKKSVSDHALAIVKAGISVVPICGGPLASLIGDYVPTATQRSIERAMELLGERLASLGDRLDIESVKKDEFSELFKSCYLSIVRTHQEEKLRAATSLIANMLLKNGDPDKLSYRELDHYARCVDSLSIGAIDVLAKTYSMLDRKRSQTGRPNVRWDQLIQERFSVQILSRQTGFSPDLVMGLLSELNALYLVHLLDRPGERTPDFGVQLTDLGVKFVVHLLQAGAE